MYLVQLIYASRVNTEAFKNNEAKSIQEAAKKNNQSLNVTGVLFCDGVHFLQALEGSRTTVSQLYNKISQDPRHTDVVILRHSDIVVRDFYSWSMELLSYKAETVQALRHYTVEHDFNPYTLSSNSSRELLRYLSSEHSV